MAKKKSDGFFQRLFASFFNSDDPEAANKRKLKAVAKRLSKSRYHFYKAGSGEVLPAFAKLFYEIYKAVTPARNMFRGIQNYNAVKRSIIEYHFSENQRKLAEGLTADAIAERVKSASVEKVSRDVNSELSAFIGEFSAERNAAIEARYKELMRFKDFCSYDYYYLLKKFDSSLVEERFTETPPFARIMGKYVADDIKDFTTLMLNITGDADWESMLKMLKSLRGVEPISPAVWKRIVARMQNIQATGVFDMMVQLITGNPNYKPAVHEVQADIVEPFIDKFKNEAIAALHKLESEEKSSKVDGLLKQIFGKIPQDYLKYYTESASEPLEKKKLRGYLYCVPLNYLKAFLIEIVKSDMRSYCDLTLVRGNWVDNALALPMSNAYNELLSVSDAITVFDENMAEDKAIGLKIKTLLPRTQHDGEAANIVNRLVGDANTEARDMIVKSMRDIVTIGKMMKALIDDEAKKAPEFIVNWREVERFSDEPLPEFSKNLYKRIYLFASLMQTSIKTQ